MITFYIRKSTLGKLRLHFLAHFLTTYVPCLHFLCSKLHVFLTTYPPLSANVICESSLNVSTKMGGRESPPLPPGSDGPVLKRSIVEEEGVSCVQQPRIGVVGIKISIAQSTRTICLRQDFNPGVANDLSNLNSKSKLSFILSQIIVNLQANLFFQLEITCAQNFTIENQILGFFYYVCHSFF